jgi:phosphoglycerate dehydrogenase-like enzyme
MAPRVLVTLRRRPEVQQELGRQLPRGSWRFATEAASPISDANVEVLLVGDLERELPDWRSRNFPKLRLVQCIYTGVEHLPISDLPKGTRIAGNSGAYSEPVAEHAVALVLAAAKRLHQGQSLMDRGALRPVPRSAMLVGRRGVVLGVGGIGRAVARRLRALGVSVDGVNRDGRRVPGVRRMYPARQLRRALVRADVVVNCLPSSRSTRLLLGAKEFSLLPPGAIYVNVGRAETTDPAALETWLRAEERNSAGIDVWWGEEFAAGRVNAPIPVAELPNLISSPHSAAIAEGAAEHALACAIRNVANFLAGRRVRGIVDRAEYG